MSTRPRKSAEQRKTEIVDATLKLAYELGPEGITTDGIARKVGISQPAVFRHFPRKEDIWVAVMGWIGERLARRWGAVLEEHHQGRDRLKAIVRTQLELIQRTPAIPAILFSRELHVRNRLLRKAVKALLKRFHDLLCKVLEEGRCDGSLRGDIDPSDSAYLVIALVQGLAVRWSLTGRGFDLVDEGERLLDVVLLGLSVPVSDKGGC